MIFKYIQLLAFIKNKNTYSDFKGIHKPLKH